MKDWPYCDEIHNWFELTYSSYAVIPRLLLDDLPEEMQQKFLEVMGFIEKHYNNETWISNYMVRGRAGGKFVTDPLRDYRRGDIWQYRKDKPNEDD